MSTITLQLSQQDTQALETMTQYLQQVETQLSEDGLTVGYSMNTTTGYCAMQVFVMLIVLQGVGADEKTPVRTLIVDGQQIETSGYTKAQLQEYLEQLVQSAQVN